MRKIGTLTDEIVRRSLIDVVLAIGDHQMQIDAASAYRLVEDDLLLMLSIALAASRVNSLDEGAWSELDGLRQRLAEVRAAMTETRD